MHHVKLLILSLLLSVAYVGYGQVTFDSTLVYNQKAKLGRFYFDLMQHVGSVKVINEDGYDRSIASPNKISKGEATFIYEVANNDSLINVYMTEFWYYSLIQDEIAVKDYIVFVDEDNMGFDEDKILQYKIDPTSKELIRYLFDYVKKNRKFKVIKPRGKNLKFQRVPFG